MIERCHGARLALEAFIEAFGGDFDGHVASQPRIMRAIDFSHAAGADGTEDLVRAEFRAG